ncbi:hypothetical protein BpHYR1_005475 [Brachionus plicatilis]|uniref:Uncharacterized protein n=1 Tax=Brachionus plicatilis TaxID=10195 RepID=A0A3M7S3F0_BRAPC|nr:hypothetical protein BpHYR1_005475 [Brachionus plicatilis]
MTWDYIFLYKKISRGLIKSSLAGGFRIPLNFEYNLATRIGIHFKYLKMTLSIKILKDLKDNNKFLNAPPQIVQFAFPMIQHSFGSFLNKKL